MCLYRIGLNRNESYIVAMTQLDCIYTRGYYFCFRGH